jgi:hypothetical protein
VPETYKGLTVPEYSDTADGVAAIRNLVDSGPIARVDDAQLGAMGEAGPEVGTIVYYETFNALLQWCGPTLTWKPVWIGPWGRVAHWVGTNNSTHNETESTVTGFSDLEWTAYDNRYYKVTVTGRLVWSDYGAAQGDPSWVLDTNVARSVVLLRNVDDNSLVRRVYDGRASFVNGADVDLFSTSFLIEGLSGTQNWKLSAGVATGVVSDDVSFAVNGDEYGTLVLIEDIGPSGAPT